MTEKPPPPSGFDDLDLPATLDAFFEHCLAKEAADRFDGALEMTDAFAAAAGAPEEVKRGLSSRPPAPREVEAGGETMSTTMQEATTVAIDGLPGKDGKWLPIAAAAMLLGGVGAFLLLTDGAGPDAEPATAGDPAATVTQPTPTAPSPATPSVAASAGEEATSAASADAPSASSASAASSKSASDGVRDVAPTRPAPRPKPPPSASAGKPPSDLFDQPW